MATMQAATPFQIADILSAFSVELSTAQKAARDYDMAARLDRKGDEYQVAGNEKMAAVCRSRALAACIRADRYSAS